MSGYPSGPFRLVLMSATADFRLYEDYFSELGREDKVERIAIPHLASALQSTMLQTKVKYLENVSWTPPLRRDTGFPF